MLKLRVPIELPDQNQIIKWSNVRGRYSAYSRHKKTLTEQIGNIARRAIGRVTSYPVECAIRWFCPNKRKDPDNIAGGKKFILDALVAADILENDRWAHICSFEDSFEVGEPGALVELRRPRAIILKEVVQLVFHAGSFVNQAQNLDPQNLPLDAAEARIDKALQLLCDLQRGEVSRFDYLESLVRKDKE